MTAPGGPGTLPGMDRFPANPDSLEDPLTLVDDEGTRWVLHRRRLDIRVVRRLVRDPAAPLVWGDVGGLVPRPVCAGERDGAWERIKGEYAGPGGVGPGGRYLAHEFRADPGRRLLYVEDHC